MRGDDAKIRTESVLLLPSPLLPKTDVVRASAQQGRRTTIFHCLRLTKDRLATANSSASLERLAYFTKDFEIRTTTIANRAPSPTITPYPAPWDNGGEGSPPDAMSDIWGEVVEWARSEGEGGRGRMGRRIERREKLNLVQEFIWKSTRYLSQVGMIWDLDGGIHGVCLRHIDHVTNRHEENVRTSNGVRTLFNLERHKLLNYSSSGSEDLS